jgi:molybdenum cofactor sulfurtransferase
MQANLFGNPHSQSPSSLLSTLRIESVRAQVLKFFKADPASFDVVFLANATAAIKLVMDALRDHDRGQRTNSFWYGYHADSHTSLVGVREVATAGAKCFASDLEVEDWLTGGIISPPNPQGTPESPGIGLFAYPAQSNMNGRRLPLNWPGQLRASRLPQHQNVFSLLDAAAFVSTAQLDLSDWRNAPDFTALSFYKIFGYPDLGALLVRKSAGLVLCQRPYFGGGTVDMVINAIDHPNEAWHARKEMTIHEALEDGTPAFHSIIALDSAMKAHRALYGSMDQVSRHTGALAKVLYESLSALKHANGVEVCKIYNDAASNYSDSKTQGPTIAFNVRTASGSWIPKSYIEQLAIINKIQLRTGGVCNPGGIAHFLGVTAQELRHNFTEGLRCGNALDIIDGKPTGIIRVSLGAMSSMGDIDKFVNFMHLFVKGSSSAARVSTVPFRNADTAFQCLTLGMELMNIFDPTFMGKIQENEFMNLRTCPVAACGAHFNSEIKLQEHFQAHKIGSSSWPYSRVLDVLRLS